MSIFYEHTLNMSHLYFISRGASDSALLIRISQKQGVDFPINSTQVWMSHHWIISVLLSRYYLKSQVRFFQRFANCFWGSVMVRREVLWGHLHRLIKLQQCTGPLFSYSILQVINSESQSRERTCAVWTGDSWSRMQKIFKYFVWYHHWYWGQQKAIQGSNQFYWAWQKVDHWWYADLLQTYIDNTVTLGCEYK